MNLEVASKALRLKILAEHDIEALEDTINVWLGELDAQIVETQVVARSNTICAFIWYRR